MVFNNENEENMDFSPVDLLILNIDEFAQVSGILKKIRQHKFKKNLIISILMIIVILFCIYKLLRLVRIV